LILLEKDAESEPEYSKELYELRIIRTILELYIAGNDTTASTLTWMFLLLAVHPDVLRRMQEELDSVCEKSSTIRVEHKNDLPYCRAVIDETIRFSSIVPLSLFHRTTSDTTLMGFNIPVDTMVIPHLYGVHHDPSYWERPNEFYPEHFLEADKKTYKTREHLIPFSMGPRTCMGELLAVMELFLISTSVAREFTVSLAGNHSKEDIAELLVGGHANIRRAGVHKLIFTKR